MTHKSTTGKKFLFIWALFFALFISHSQSSLSATVLQLDMDYMLNQAELVFEGEVIASEARWNDSQTSIATHITFRIDDIIKGSHENNTITLKFAGGEVDGIGLKVSSMVYPAVGESGIYFVESQDQELINPLVGWSQGHFRLQADDENIERVLSEEQEPILDVDTTEKADYQFKRNAPPTLSNSNTPFSHGAAKGLTTGKKHDKKQKAMNKKAFKDALKIKLEQYKKQKTKNKLLNTESNSQEQ